MNEFYHEIDEQGVYHIFQNEKPILSIELDKELEQAIIKTDKEVFAGPVDLIKFSGDTWQK